VVAKGKAHKEATNKIVSNFCFINQSP